MRGLLTEDGIFVAERKTGFEEMACPYGEQGTPCGTWCALFSEPLVKKNERFNRQETLVNLCGGRYWKFTEFEDQRPDNPVQELSGGCDL